MSTGLIDQKSSTLRTGIGVNLILVDALHERAAGFYERRDFKRFQDDPPRLYLPMDKVRDLFPEEGNAATGGTILAHIAQARLLIVGFSSSGAGGALTVCLANSPATWEVMRAVVRRESPAHG